MKKAVYLIFFSALFFISCGDDDKLTNVKGISYIDLSDLTVYKGSVNGAEQVVYNDLKNRTLATYFFQTAYAPNQFTYYNIEFFNDILTFVYGSSQSSQTKIVAPYTFKDGKLFILNADTLKFVAYGDNPDNLYLQKSIARYPSPVINRDSIQVFDVAIDSDTLMKLSGIQSLENMKKEGDTIVWCNIKYYFN